MSNSSEDLDTILSQIGVSDDTIDALQAHFELIQNVAGVGRAKRPQLAATIHDHFCEVLVATLRDAGASAEDQGIGPASKALKSLPAGD